MDVDPAASLRCWAIEIQVAGRTFDVPPLPAADWLPVLTSGDPGRVLDLIASDPADPDNLDDLLLTGQVDAAELGTALVDAIEAAAGRSLHAALVLAVAAESQWSAINGRLAERGFRWDVMPLGAALDAIYLMIVGGLEDEPRKKFLDLLDNETLTGGKRRGPDPEKALSNFAAIAGPKPEGVRSTVARSGSERTRTQRRPPRPRPDGP